ncbi:MAG: response regulator [Flavobacterium sp.]|nr:response regulator [Flavobacterium sp.]
MSTPITTVMIIDDNAVDLYIASRMVKTNLVSTTVLEYSTAFEALEFLKQHQDDVKALPEIIFVDIYMPQMSGFEFMEGYDNLSPLLKKHSRVYILSSSIDDGDIARARINSNTCSFLVKPITKNFLDSIGNGSL